MKYQLTESNVKDLIEWTKQGHIQRVLNALVNLRPTAKVEPTAQPAAWESTTAFFTKYVSDQKYQAFSKAVKSQYKPYLCSNCTTTPPPVAGDAERLDWLQRRGATVSMVPSNGSDWLFQIGGLYVATDMNIRIAIDAAIAAGGQTTHSKQEGAKRELSDREWSALPSNLREGCTTHVPGVGDI